MLVTFARGHMVICKSGSTDWRYADTHEPADDSRPCLLCHKPPTPEGHDPCLGCIPGVISACCGHGVTAGFKMLEGGTVEPIEVPDNVVDDILNGLEEVS